MSASPSTRVTLERLVSEKVIDDFLPIYRASFAHLAERSAAKQVLDDEEFRQLLASSSTVKFCGWRGDRLVALALMTHDLALVPWVSIPFFWKQYPTEMAEGQIGYFLTLLVEEPERGGPWMTLLLEALSLYSVSRGVVMIFDCCRYNIEEIDVPGMIRTLGERYVDVETERIDIQHYYAYLAHDAGRHDFNAIADAGIIDLTIDPATELDVIDLRVSAPTLRPDARSDTVS